MLSLVYYVHIRSLNMPLKIFAIYRDVHQVDTREYVNLWRRHTIIDHLKQMKIQLALLP